MLEALSHEFMRNALYAGLLASATCGVIGALVVVNRLAFLSGGIAHAAYGGVGMAFFFGFSPLLGTLGFSLAAALVMAGITLRSKGRSDTVVGVLWAAGMAAGVIFADLTPGYPADLMSYLFGSILTVGHEDLWVMGTMCAGVLFVAVFWHNDLLALSYDPDFARLRGVPVTFLHFLLLCMIALAVVMLVRVVGLILIVAFLTIPPYMAEQWTSSLARVMALSALLCAVFTVTGLAVSYALNLTSGASIILVAAAAFFADLAVARLRQNA
ncbi:MAG: metal ABC transporter permease [Deltaproteobacteria bacterium]|nr:metal ABC transporter permease [Deltaproteobacteria bacterium]